MKRILSLLVVLAMVVSMIPSVFARNEIDMDELLGRLEILDSIEEIPVALGEGPVAKMYQWTPDKDGILSIAFELQGAEIEVTITQGDKTVTYNGVDAFELEVVAGTAVQIIVSKASDAAVEFTMYGSFKDPLGSEGNPYMLFEPENTVETKLENTWFQCYFAGTIMTVAGEGAFSVTVDGTATAAEGGVVTMPVTSPDPRMPFTFSIDAIGTYSISFAYPEGHFENPAELVIGENTAEIEAGSQGYYYNWTAEAGGELTITMPAEGNWQYVVNNMTSYVYGENHCSADDPAVPETTISVKAGDEIELVVNTFNPEDAWNTPAGTITFTAAFEAAVEGSENNPIMLQPEWNEEQTAATVTVTAPVGTTYYAVFNAAGMELSINGGEPVVLEGQPRTLVTFPITNDGETEAEYVLVFTYPVGSQMNPAELVMGENTAEIAANAQGYFYTWTAEAAGELTITMPEGDWTYVLNNLTTGIYGDTQWSDSDPVVAEATITVAAGDEIQLIVNTYDPTGWDTPAGTITFTAEFTVAYVVGDLDGVEGVDEADAIYLLQHILMPQTFQVEQPVDYDKSGTVDEDDAIYLLQHVLMPNQFPL